MAYQAKQPRDPNALNNQDEEDQNNPTLPLVTDPSSQDPFTPTGPNAAVEPPGSTGGEPPPTPPVDPTWDQPPAGGGEDGIRNPPVLGLGPELGKPTDDPGVQTPGYVPDAGGGSSDQGPLIANRLRELFSQGSSADINDPALASSRLTNQRNFENQRALLAERSGVEGTGDSGGFDSRLLGLGQERGAADLAAAGGANKDRMTQIMEALRLASANQQGNNQTGFNYAQLEALLNSQELSALMGGA